jgi:hypothetical protein
MSDQLKRSPKKALIDYLLSYLEVRHQTALRSSEIARASAANKANVAENKYDTLGTEASYLVDGQAKRALACLDDVNAVKHMRVINFTVDDAIALGTYIQLVDQDDRTLCLFLAPVSGGLKFHYNDTDIMIITPQSPLGHCLLGKFVDDEFDFGEGAHKKHYVIQDIN